MENNDLLMFNQTVKYEHNLIWVKPVCDLFELHAKNQYTKIKNDAILGNLVGKNRPDLGKNENLRTKTSTDLGIIDDNGRIFLSKKGFLRWIQIINANTISDKHRDKFIIYQTLISDFLYGNFETEEQMRVDYVRLDKLKKLNNKISAEIRRLDKNVKNFMGVKYGQLSLEFKGNKQLTQ